MALALNKIIVSGIGADSPAAYFDAGSQTVAAGSDVVIPAGLYIMFPVANLSVKASLDGSTFTSIMAASTTTGGVVISDGVNVKWSSASGTVTAQYLTVNGGQAATGTYNT
jgi:hypothetical protein